jgi:hypothetical protein
VRMLSNLMPNPRMYKVHATISITIEHMNDRTQCQSYVFRIIEIYISTTFGYWLTFASGKQVSCSYTEETRIPFITLIISIVDTAVAIKVK